jgi:NAD(P)-dependent dehydrogenase (short-subunit alcohol dehydrogenase family)
VAVVTGGGRGIGAGISKALAHAGYDIVIGWTSDEAAAKQTAADGLGQVAALELGELGITVNTVCPGIIETDMVSDKWASESAITGKPVDEIRAEITAETLTGSLCRPDDVGQTVVWLVGPGARNITGQSVCVNAGVTLH